MAIPEPNSSDSKDKKIDDTSSNKSSSNSRAIPRSPKAPAENSVLSDIKKRKTYNKPPKPTSFIERMMASEAPLDPESDQEPTESTGLFGGLFGEEKEEKVKGKEPVEQSFLERMLGRETNQEEEVEKPEEPKGMFEGFFNTKKDEPEAEKSDKTKETSTLDKTNPQKPLLTNTQDKTTTNKEDSKSESEPKEGLARDVRDNVENSSSANPPKYKMREPSFAPSDDNQDLDNNVSTISEEDSDQQETTSNVGPRPGGIIGNNRDQSDSSDDAVQSDNSRASGYKPGVIGDQINNYQNPDPAQPGSTLSGSNRDRYASSAPSQSSNVGMKFETTTTTQNVSLTIETKQFNPRRNPVRSQARNEARAKKGINPVKIGLIALAASIGLNSNVNPVQASSGIFDTPKSEVNKPAKEGQYFEDQTSKQSNDGGLDQFGVDEIGYNKDGDLSQEVNKGSKPKSDQQKDSNSRNQSGSGSAGQGNETKNDTTSSSPSKSPASTAPTSTGPIPSLPTSEGQGEYEDGRLKVPLMEKTGFESTDASGKSKSQKLDNQSPPNQPIPNIPPRTPSAPVPQVAKMDGKGKKKIDPQKLMAAIFGPWISQGVITGLIIFALLAGLIGGLVLGTSKILATFCTSTEFVRGLPGIKDSAPGQFASKLCETLKALTGIGCGSLDSASATGIGCVGKILDGAGDTINLSGPNGTTPVKKACVQEIITAGKKAGVKEFTIRFAISIHPIESVGDCFKAVNPYGCLGLAQFCPGSYESAIVGAGVTSTADFLANPDKQMKAIDTFLDEKRSFFGGLPACVEDHFKGKSEQYKLSYLWLTGGCPGTVDANGFNNDKYGSIADENFKATDCAEFKAKIVSKDQTNYWSVINSISNLKLTPVANAQDNTAKVADKALQDKVIDLINSGKINLELSPKEAFIADIRGTDYPNPYGNRPNGPLHYNTAQMLILLAEKFPGWYMTSLGNMTHSNSGGYHNKTPIQAIDIGSLRAPYASTQDDSTELMNKALQVLYDSKIVKNIGLPPSDLSRLDPKLVEGLQAFTDGPGQIHVSILASGVLGSAIGDGTTSDCQFDTAQVANVQDKQDITKRLNQKSLTDTEWNTLQKQFGRIFTADELVRIGDDATFGAAPTKVLFENQAASDRIYNLAKEAGYKQRIAASTGALVGTGEQRMTSTAKKALEQLAIAAKKDGYSIELKSGFRNSDEQKEIFETRLQELCNQKIGADCSVADLAAGKHDDLIKTRLTKSSVPGYSKHHTGLAADVGEPSQTDLESIKTTELYKWMVDDNYFNLKRFGFIPSYPDGGNNMGPFPEPWEILYVGPTSLQNNLVEN